MATPSKDPSLLPSDSEDSDYAPSEGGGGDSGPSSPILGPQDDVQQLDEGSRARFNDDDASRKVGEIGKVKGETKEKSKGNEKKRKRSKKKEGTGGQGGVKRRKSSDGNAIVAEKAPAMTTQEVDDLWAEFNKPQGFGDKSGTEGNGSSSNNNIGDGSTAATTANGGGMVKVVKEYKFAGQITRHESILPITSLEAQEYLKSNPDAIILSSESSKPEPSDSSSLSKFDSNSQSTSTPKSDEAKQKEGEDVGNVPPNTDPFLALPITHTSGQITSLPPSSSTSSSATSKSSAPPTTTGQKPGPKKKRANLAALAAGIGAENKGGGKPQKLTTLEKSKMDWDRYLASQSPDLNVDLERQRRNKDGYLDKQDFLDRTNEIRERKELEAREANKKK